MNAREALQLPEHEFLQEVAKVIVPKPWEHVGGIVNCRCSLCGEETVDNGVTCGGQGLEHMHYWPEGSSCNVPHVKLTEPLEVIAQRLKERVVRESNCDTYVLCGAFVCHGREYIDCWGVSTKEILCWLALSASPQEQIACCLVTLGLWEI